MFSLALKNAILLILIILILHILIKNFLLQQSAPQMLIQQPIPQIPAFEEEQFIDTGKEAQVKQDENELYSFIYNRDPVTKNQPIPQPQPSQGLMSSLDTLGTLSKFGDFAMI